MKLLSVFSPVLLLASMAPAQATGPLPTDNGFVLRLEPRDMEKNAPEAFEFKLTNESDHDIRLPQPAIECEDPPWDGSFSLTIEFKPLDGGKGHGRFCTSERTDSRPILERIKTWKTLHPGESIAVKASKEQLLYNNDGAGIYEFRAFYNPPVMTHGDRELLRRMGIVIPEHGLSTVPITLVKKP